MYYISILKPIIYQIKGFDGYGFSNDKLLYDLKRCKVKKQVSNNGSLGYILNGKFMSLKNIKLLIYKPDKINYPF